MTDAMGMVTANGGKPTAEQLKNYYPERRSEFPFGRYCCGLCHLGRETVG